MSYTLILIQYYVLHNLGSIIRSYWCRSPPALTISMLQHIHIYTMHKKVSLTHDTYLCSLFIYQDGGGVLYICTFVAPRFPALM
jgi:hypothetical protein